jgi:hypothetical protein
VRKLTQWDSEVLIVVFMYLLCLTFVIWPPSREEEEPSKEHGRSDPATA